MIRRSRKSQQEHDRLITFVADFLRQNNYRDIRADLPGFQIPAAVTSDAGAASVPDVTAVGKRLNVFEVETADSIESEHCADEWRAFSSYAERNNAIFWVVVPTGHRTAADFRLMELEIDGRILEI